MDQLMSQ